jgi:hypothetical protein
MILVDHLQKRSLRARPANIVLGRPRVAMSASTAYTSEAGPQTLDALESKTC